MSFAFYFDACSSLHRNDASMRQLWWQCHGNDLFEFMCESKRKKSEWTARNGKDSHIIKVNNSWINLSYLFIRATSDREYGSNFTGTVLFPQASHFSHRFRAYSVCASQTKWNGQKTEREYMSGTLVVWLMFGAAFEPLKWKQPFKMNMFAMVLLLAVKQFLEQIIHN